MLTGQAKTDYQRKYMRQYMRDRRAGNGVKTQANVLRPEQPAMLRPKPAAVKTQSHNPLMVGYVPPT